MALMVIELSEPNGSIHRIDSSNTELIAKWVAEWIPYICESMANMSHYTWRISVYSWGEKEQGLPAVTHQLPLDKNGCLAISKLFFTLAGETSMVHGDEKRSYE